MFATGLSSISIVIGLTLGAYANWLYVAPRLRTYTEVASNSLRSPLSLENRFGEGSRIYKLISALVILIFFTFYVSSGMVSGGVLFQSTFGLDYHTGLWIFDRRCCRLYFIRRIPGSKLDRLASRNHHVRCLDPCTDRYPYPCGRFRSFN